MGRKRTCELPFCKGVVEGSKNKRRCDNDRNIHLHQIISKSVKRIMRYIESHDEFTAADVNREVFKSKLDKNEKGSMYRLFQAMIRERYIVVLAKTAGLKVYIYSGALKNKQSAEQGSAPVSEAKPLEENALQENAAPAQAGSAAATAEAAPATVESAPAQSTSATAESASAQTETAPTTAESISATAKSAPAQAEAAPAQAEAAKALKGGVNSPKSAEKSAKAAAPKPAAAGSEASLKKSAAEKSPAAKAKRTLKAAPKAAEKRPPRAKEVVRFVSTSKDVKEAKPQVQQTRCNPEEAIIGILRDFVYQQNGQWNHDAWTSLINRPDVARFGLHESDIGRLLEEEKAKYWFQRNS